MPKKTASDAKKICPTSRLFLFNLHTRVLWGIFEPVDLPKNNIVTNAWGGRFPMQLRVRVVSGRGLRALKEKDFPEFMRQTSNRSGIITKEHVALLENALET